MTDDKTEAAIRRAAKAKELLEDPMIAQAFADIHADCIAAFTQSEPDDAAIREDAHRMLRALAAFRAEFERHLASGQVAQRALADQELWDAVRATNRGA